MATELLGQQKRSKFHNLGLKDLKTTSKQYASTSKAHGVSYIGEAESFVVDRIFWVIIVVLSLAFTIFQILMVYDEWKDRPVVTTLDTEALSIEDIPFPAVTICPQGSANNLVDRVLFKQVVEYIKSNTPEIENATEPWNFTDQEVASTIKEFLRDVYPGAKGNPAKYVRLMSSSNPQRTLETDAILYPGGGETDAILYPGVEGNCDQSYNEVFTNSLNKQLNSHDCPDGFDLVGHHSCLHISEKKMTYLEASNYCNTKGGADLSFDQIYEAIEAINEKDTPGQCKKFSLSLRVLIYCKLREYWKHLYCYFIYYRKCY